MSEPRPPRPCLWALLLALAAGAAAFWRSYYCYSSDAEVLLDRAWRILQGQLPYRDFYCVTTPLPYYALAGLWRLFGPHYLATQVYAAVQCSLTVALTYAFCRRGAGLCGGWSLGLAALQAVWAPSLMIARMWYDNDGAFFGLVAGLMVFLAAARGAGGSGWALGARRRWALAGLAAAVPFWCKQDMGAGALAGGLAAAYVCAWAGGADWRTPAAYLAGAFAGLALPAAYFAGHGAFGEMLAWISTRGLSMKMGEAMGLASMAASLLSPFTTSIDRASKLFVVLYALGPLACGLRWRRTREPAELAGLGAGLVWLGAYYAGLFTHGGQGYTVMLAALGGQLALLARPWPERDGDAVLARSCGAGLAAAAVFLAALGLRKLGNEGRPAQRPQRLTAERLSGLYVPAHDPIGALIADIQAAVPPGEPVATLRRPALYFATGRMAPHPITMFSLGEVQPGDEEDILRRLDAAGVRWAVRWDAHEAASPDPWLGMERLQARLSRGAPVVRRGAYAIWRLDVP